MLIKNNKSLIYGAVGISGFTLFLTLELISAGGPFSLSKLLFESLELLLIIGTAAGTTFLYSEFRVHREAQVMLVEDLETARSEGLAWRTRAQKHILGLSEAIQDQFKQWAFTPAESAVAMLMLKGLSHKEIARLRNANEATVRQQAGSIYAKANVTSRNMFCAYFLEDLLVPSDNDGTDPEPQQGRL